MYDAKQGILDHHTGKIAHLLHDPDLSEISINYDGKVWIERMGETHQTLTDVIMTADDVENIGRCVAGVSDVTFGESQPIVTANVPTQNGNARVQVVIPPATTGIGTVSIRLLGVRHVDISAYEFADTDEVIAEERDLDLLRQSRDHLKSRAITFQELSKRAVQNKWNVIIAGGTSSGKTTVLNSKLRLIDPTERILTIEEVAELQLEQPNVVTLLSDRSQDDSHRSPIKLMEASLRLRPDRVICGEIRGDDANTVLELVNTGHEGTMFTMHANSPLDAVRRLTKMARRGSPTVSREEILDDIRATIHLIVHMKKIGKKRKVSGVIFPPLLKRKDFK